MPTRAVLHTGKAAPRILGRPFNVQHARLLSLWSSAAPTSEPSTPVPPVRPPSIAEMTTPLSLPPPTFFEPASTVLLSLPPSLHLSYALFIPLWTLLLRSSTTLPLTLWQRARTRKFADKVLPLIRQAQHRISLQTRDECRRAAKSYEEYQKEFQKRAKAEAKRIARQHNASPMVTLLVPPLLHLPIFISMTLIIRDACQRASTTLSLTPSSFTQLLANVETESTLTSTALAHLQEFATTPLYWCPSLILPDSTMMLPLAVGLAALANVEVSAKTRKANAAAALASRPAQGSDGVQASGPLTAAQKRRVVAKMARAGDVVMPGTTKPVSRGYASSAPVQGPSVAVMEETEDEPRTTRIITNALRFSAVLFIPFAAFAPSAVCVYWLTSNMFTLVQNTVFAWYDRKRDQQQRIQRILRGRT
ncbi:hypothetical protein OIV83_005278 [Microbotryomycetes sp. JL201]|nr:hypothetical protein OIV83_005278 [Microbotryomycetes sp. JL201]